LPFGDRNIFRQTVRQHTDVVDHDIYPVEPVRRCAPNPFERIVIRDIGTSRRYRGSSAAQLSGEIGQYAGDGATYAAGRSGDDGDLIAQGIHSVKGALGSAAVVGVSSTQVNHSAIRAVGCDDAQHSEVDRPGWCCRRRCRRCAGSTRSTETTRLHCRRGPGPAASEVGRIRRGRISVEVGFGRRFDREQAIACRKSLSTRSLRLSGQQAVSRVDSERRSRARQVSRLADFWEVRSWPTMAVVPQTCW